MNKQNKYIISFFTTFAFVILAYGSSDDGGSSSSSSSSPYSNVSVALRLCADELKSETASGYYDHLSDVEMYRRMEADQESCMAGYGNYPK